MKCKILVAGNELEHEGGVVEFNKGLINYINRYNNEVTLEHIVIGSRMSLFYYPIIKKVVYPFYFCFDVLRIIVKLVFDKKVKIVQLNPSLIPIPILRDSIVFYIAKVVFKKKIILIIHGWKDYFYKRLLNNRLLMRSMYKLFNRSDVIYVLSKEFKTKLALLGIDENKIKITTTFFFKDNIVIEDHENNYGSLVRFIYLGRISMLKGIDELISALIEYNKHNINFTCTLIGHEDKPGIIDEYKKTIKDNGLSDRVLFLGRIIGSKKFEILSKSDIFIFPSYTEGCPTSVIEALATGLFTIASNVGALREIINEGNGILINPGSSKELVNAMYKATESINDIREQRNNISAKTNQKYEISIIAREFMETYACLLTPRCSNI